MGDCWGCFCIADADREWTWAHAWIEGDTAIVNSLQVARPAVVRYPWPKYRCGANLFNKAGLPTPTFRTDTWPLTSQGTLAIEQDCQWILGQAASRKPIEK